MNTPALRVSDISKHYVTGEAERLDVLKGITMEVAAGEICTILGASGTGKSTLLHIIGTLDKPSSGEVMLDGRAIGSLSDKELARYRNENIGFVFQFHHLLPEFSALENVAMPALIAGVAQDVALSNAKKILERVRVDHRKDARPAQLSGGEQQRVAVARALINQPKLILADEPSGNLDEENAEALHELFWEVARERNQTCVIVTHDKRIAEQADTRYTLSDGTLTQDA
ncbi:MAG: lipoprotein-releasing system ATP-binding protein LolD [Ectothiorhodospiraceae bacterium]|nr:lipoprotein-releasing system ATP-binding protein LolD [Ectothiorhodospiraceae bacterium]